MKSTALLALLLFVGVDVAANNLFIPNYYRNRRVPNDFSALGWSDRKEVSVEGSQAKSAEETLGVDTEETKDRSFQGQAYYRFPQNFNLEFAGSKSKLKVDNKGLAANSEYGLEYLSLGMGYEMPSAPIAFGATVTTIELVSAPTNTPLEAKVFSVGGGYRLPNNVFLGVGMTRTDAEVGTPKVETTDHSFLLGGGMVFGDLKVPQMAFDVALSYSNEDHIKSYGALVQGLLNYQTMQFYGKASYDIESGEDKDKESELVLGADFGFGDIFYVGPEIKSSDKEDRDKVAAAESKTKSAEISVEGGVRTGKIEAYVRLTAEATEQKYELLPTADTDTRGTGIAMGASYHF